MRLSPLEKRARELSKAVGSLGKSTKPSLSERAGILQTIKGAAPIKGADGYTPKRGVDYFTKEDIDAIKKELLDPTHITEIIKVMKELPESARLEVSDIRNYQSFVFNKTKYGVHEMMHGGSAGSITVITISGTINDANVSFTASTQPTLLNINGAFYYTSGGAITWSYTSGTITLSSPVGTGGSIFGI